LYLIAGSGSDASSLSTRAELDESTGEFVINGGKAFISGAGSLAIYFIFLNAQSLTMLYVLFQ